MKFPGFFPLLAALLLLAGSASADPILYIDDANGNLGTVDIATGLATVIGSTGVALTDIAFDPFGQLWGISYTDLYEIDPDYAFATDIGPHGIPEANALVFGSDGTLYAAGAGSTGLYFIFTDSGASYEFADIGFESAGDLAFDNGQLYLSSTTNQLVLINSSTYQGSITGYFGFSDVQGLATADNGVLYGVSGTQVFSVNITTGAGTLLFDYAGQGLGAAYGAAFATESMPVITSSPTASGQIASFFSYQITATNQPYYYYAAGLPPGLELSSSTGVISGTPTQIGTYTVELSAFDTGGGEGDATLTVTIVQETPPVVTSAASAEAKTGVFYHYQITATNSPTGFAASNIPPGLVFYSDSGVISGTPTQTGTFTIPFSTANQGGTGTGKLTLSITAGPPTLPVVTFNANIASVTEGSGRFGEFTITRLGTDKSGSLQIFYRTKGTAINGKDYLRLTGVKTMKPGQRSIKIPIRPIDGSVAPGDERAVVLVVKSGHGYIVETPSSDTVNIRGQ